MKEVRQVALEQYTKQVPGKKKGDILLFALSTCGWCKKTKNLLSELGAEYRYIDVDLLEGGAKNQVIERVKSWNPSCSFPTMVINNKCIVGYQEEAIREALSSGEN
jgi:glutaredoxin-like protein NrdH